MKLQVCLFKTILSGKQNSWKKKSVFSFCKKKNQRKGTLEKNLAASESSKLSNLPTNLISWLFGNPFFTKALVQDADYLNPANFPGEREKKHTKGKLKQSRVVDRMQVQYGVMSKVTEVVHHSTSGLLCHPDLLQKSPWNSICGQEKVGRQKCVVGETQWCELPFLYRAHYTPPQESNFFISLLQLTSHHTQFRNLDGGRRRSLPIQSIPILVKDILKKVKLFSYLGLLPFGLLFLKIIKKPIWLSNKYVIFF